MTGKKFDRDAALAKLREDFDELFADVQADPGDGVLEHHLVAVRSNLESLEALEAAKAKER